MRNTLGLIGALGIGAAGMYLLDPDRGRRRRAIVRDKTMSLTKGLGDGLGKSRRDLANRTRGIIHDVSSMFRSLDIDDDTLVERVRSRLGRCVTHPRAVHVSAADGVVTLGGVVPESEFDELIDAIESMPGVADVVNELEVHVEAPAGISDDGVVTTDEVARPDRLWSPATKLIVGGVGSALAVAGALQLSGRGVSLGGARRSAIRSSKSSDAEGDGGSASKLDRRAKRSGGRRSRKSAR
jgi:hypothetical protein